MKRELIVEDSSAERPASRGLLGWPLQQLRIYLTAQSFLTRIPCPEWVGYSDELLQRSARYYPLVGVTVGLIAFGVFSAAAFVLPITIALILSLAASGLVTGAFHEDGFADFCDGFGGGWEKEQILTIMKDSRIGAYGAMGMLLLLALKFECLRQLATGLSLLPLGLIFLSAHSASRWLAVSFMRSHQYVRTDEQSKSKAAATILSHADLSIALVIAIVPISVLAWLWTPKVFWLLIPLAVVRWLFGRMLSARLGGYTGDCLGAAQQVAEMAVYLTLCGVLKLEFHI